MFGRRVNATLNLLLTSVLLFSGCRNGADTVHYLGDADLNYYKDRASEVAYPVVCHETAEEVQVTQPPRTIESREHDELWDMTLQEALHIALKNSKIIKSAGQYLSPGNGLYTNAANTPSVYDPAIQETNVLFGGLGVEAALSSFDTNWAVSTLWGRNDQVQNGLFNGDLGGTATSETAQFNTSLNKALASGGSLSLAHNWNYLGTNANTALFPSSYAGSLSAQYRQPLLAGAGTEVTRIAGPTNPAFGAITGVSQGVVIARINNDISITNFEASVRDLLRDVETTYWNLYLAYRNYDTTTIARNSALETWRVTKIKKDVGGAQGFRNWQEPQAKDRYYETKAQTETTLSNLYSAETQLRNLLQLPVNDGRVIRPIDEPVTARFSPDWHSSLTEALTERVELRRQKWNVKSLELQLIAANNLARPRLDFVGGYQVNGFGDSLTGSADGDGVSTSGDLSSGYETMFQGDETGWSLGFEFSVPIGLRRNKTQVRNIELRLSKARKVLDAQEQEVASELATSFQEVARAYATAVSSFNRRNAAVERTNAQRVEWKSGANLGGDGNSLDRYLRAQESLANAENAYFSSIVDYNQALLDLQYRKGTLLRHNSVQLLEGGWMPKAYEQALQRAWARSHAISGPDLEASPRDFAQPIPFGGVILQNSTETPTVPAKMPADMPVEEAQPIERAEPADGGQPDPVVAPIHEPPQKADEAAKELPTVPAAPPTPSNPQAKRVQRSQDWLYGYSERRRSASTTTEMTPNQGSKKSMPTAVKKSKSTPATQVSHRKTRVKSAEPVRHANVSKTTQAPQPEPAPSGLRGGSSSIGSLLD